MSITSLRLAVDDQTLLALQRQGDRIRRDPEYVAELLLKALAPTVPAGLPFLVVSGETLDRLEQLLQGGSLLNADDLLSKVTQLAGVSFGHVRLPFTPNQLVALKEKAARQGLTVEQLLERTAPRVYEQFFDLMARA